MNPISGNSPANELERLIASLDAIVGDPARPEALRGLLTETRRALEASRDRAAWLAAIYQAFPHAYFRIDSEGRFQEVQGSSSEELYVVPRQLLGRTLLEVHPGELGRRTQEAVRQVLETRRTAVLEYELPLTSGQRATFEARLVPLAEGQVLAIVRNVTERRRTEQTLRESVERLSTVITGAPVVLWSVDAQGRFTLSEGKGLEALGLAPGQVVGQSIHELYGDHPDILDNYRRALAGESVAAVVRVGGLVFDSRFAPLRDADGTILGVIGVATDVTERSRAEEALRQSEELLRQAQKMEAIGRLAGGVAHDFNNLLTAILGCSDLLVRDLAGMDEQRRDAEMIRAAAERAAELTGQLLAFSRRQVLEPRVLDLNLVVSDTRRMLSRIVGEDIRLEFQLEESPVRVRVDPVQVEQAMLNLAINARDAMPRGGVLTVRTGRSRLDEREGRARDLEPRDYALLEFSDTGEGMDLETRSRVFEPFFTTKPRARGTGLGLAMVYGFVRQSGGAIDVESDPGRGSTFRIYLPVVPEAPESPSRSAGPALSTLGSETVMVVEDEPVVRRLLGEMLRRSGYRVLEAEQGAEALGLAASFRDPIDALVTDMVMPGMSGRELAEQMERERPGIRVLFVSGHADEDELRRGLEGQARAFLRKPFTAESLRQRLREVLGAPAPRGE